MPLAVPAEDLRRLLRATTLPKRRVAHMGSVVRRKGPLPNEGGGGGGILSDLPKVAIATTPSLDSSHSGRSTPRFTPGNTPGAPTSLGERASEGGHGRQPPRRMLAPRIAGC